MEKKLKNKYAEASKRINSWNLNIDLEEFLLNKGCEFVTNGDWIMMRCPFPDHNDSNPSFFIHKYHLGYNCYVCGSGNWKDFLEKMGWEQEDIEDVNVNQLPLALWKDFKRDINKKKIPEKFFPSPNGFKLIKPFGSSKRHYDYLDKRKIGHLIKLFNIGYTTQSDDTIRDDGKKLYGSVYKNRIIIPVHNEIGKVVWFEGRYIGMQKVSNKYWRPKGIDKTKYLFNFHRVKRKGYRWVIVVEGIIDAMMLWNWGIPAVCSFGARISEEQIALLMEFDKLYVCLDNDKAGIEGWVKIKQKLLITGTEIWRIILPRRKDINDIGKDLFLKRYQKAKRI